MASELALLLQAEPRGISWAVWIAVGIVLVAGVSLLIYFLVRMRKGERELEEDWVIAKGSLFVEETKPGPVASQEPLPDHTPASSEQVESPAAASEPAPLHQAQPPVNEVEPPAYGVRLPESDIAVGGAEDGSVLAPAQDSAIEEPEQDQSPLDYEIWAELEKEPPAREPFEPPTVEPIAPRKPVFEPPRIEPIVPRQESGPPSPESVEAASITHGASGARLIAGSPSEPRPTQVKSGDDVIRTLTTYGKYIDEDEKRGYLGTIILVLALLVVAGGVFAYFYVPGVREWFSDLRERARPGAGQAVAPEQPAPKAQILSLRPETANGKIKVRGAVYNLSNQQLPSLVMEVSLVRTDGTSSTISVPVNPASLATREQGYLSRGTFEFEYEAAQYRSYDITRLLSEGAEVLFTKSR